MDIVIMSQAIQILAFIFIVVALSEGVLRLVRWVRKFSIPKHAQRGGKRWYR